MKLFLFTILFCTTQLGRTQPPLEFAELGSSPAFCRTAGYQTGYGLVYASATGGSGVHDYQWTYLANGETTATRTWGARNPGLYEIMVTDGDGEILKDTILVDSVNPIASFNVVSDDLSIIPDGYIGFAPAAVTFINTSSYHTNPYDPSANGIFYFKPQGFEDWTIIPDDYYLSEYTYEYGGTHTARLVAMNSNGCKDTAAVTIGLFGPLDIVDNDQLGLFSIVNNSTSVTIQKHGFEEGLILNLYTLSGQQIQNRLITDSKTEISLSIASGIYIYEIIDPVSGRLRDSGKINF